MIRTDKKLEREEDFDRIYRSESEPWQYSARAVEVLRHEFLIRKAHSVIRSSERVLDVGCSLGQFTERLYGLAPEVFAIDLSPTALQRAERRCNTARESHARTLNQIQTKFIFLKASVEELPFPDTYFDLTFLCDGLDEWKLTPEQRLRALKEVARTLKSGGCAILTDYLHPSFFGRYVDIVRTGPLPVYSVEYLHDRFCYQFISWLHAVQHWKICHRLIANRTLAKFQSQISRLFGERGSKHLCIVLQKPGVAH